MNAAAEPIGGVAVASWADRNRDWLVASMDGLRLRLEGGTAGVFAAAEGFVPALAHCAQVFGLTTFEAEVLLLCVGTELDNGVRAAVARMNGGASARANFGLALARLSAPHWGAVSAASGLRFWHLVEPEVGNAVALADLRVDERILHFIAGVAASDPVLDGATFRFGDGVIPCEFSICNIGCDRSFPSSRARSNQFAAACLSANINSSPSANCAG